LSSHNFVAAPDSINLGDQPLYKNPYFIGVIIAIATIALVSVKWYKGYNPYSFISDSSSPGPRLGLQCCPNLGLLALKAKQASAMVGSSIGTSTIAAAAYAAALHPQVELRLLY